MKKLPGQYLKIYFNPSAIIRAPALSGTTINRLQHTVIKFADGCAAAFGFVSYCNMAILCLTENE